MKTSALELFLLSLWTFFAPVHLTMGVVGLAIVADTIAGRWAAAHQARQQGINPRILVTSRKTRIGFISKLLTYQSLIILVFIIDKIILNDLFIWFVPGFPVFFFMTKVLGLLLCMIEFDSISEKWYRVKGISLVQQLTSQLRNLKGVYNEVKKIKDERGPDTTTPDSTGTPSDNEPTN